MKTTCEFCEGSGKLQVGTGTPSSEGGEDWCLIDCDRCSGTGRIESRPRHTSLTLACACGRDCDQYVEFAECLDSKDLAVGGRGPCILDAAAEASLLKFLKAREGER